MKKNIVIVGAGQLGSRHLQAIALLKEPCVINVIDTSTTSLDIAQLRFEEVNGHENHTISFCYNLEEITSKTIDLVIVATNSNIRSTVIKNILKTKKVKFFILEKVLFQTLREYDEINILLKEGNTMAFVNCPRRMNRNYQEIKRRLSDQENVQMEVIGSKWNLGSNGIHFIDLFSFLTNEVLINWTSNLDNLIIDSKRNGFKEFTGNLFGIGTNKNRISLTCFNRGPANLSIRISTPEMRFIINEDISVIEEILSSSGHLEEEIIKFSLQSELTNTIAKQLFETGSCILTPYEESSKLHKPFLETLLMHFCHVKKRKTDICLIT